MIQQAIQIWRNSATQKLCRPVPTVIFIFANTRSHCMFFLHSQPPKGVVQLANPNLMCCCWSGHDEWSATQYSRDTCIIFLLAWCLVFLFGLFVPEMFDAAVYSHFLKSVVILFWLLFCSESSSCCHVVASLRLVASGAGSMTIIFFCIFQLAHHCTWRSAIWWAGIVQWIWAEKNWWKKMELMAESGVSPGTEQ